MASRFTSSRLVHPARNEDSKAVMFANGDTSSLRTPAHPYMKLVPTAVTLWRPESCTSPRELHWNRKLFPTVVTVDNGERLNLWRRVHLRMNSSPTRVTLVMASRFTSSSVVQPSRNPDSKAVIFDSGDTSSLRTPTKRRFHVPCLGGKQVTVPIHLIPGAGGIDPGPPRINRITHPHISMNNFTQHPPTPPFKKFETKRFH